MKTSEQSVITAPVRIGNLILPGLLTLDFNRDISFKRCKILSQDEKATSVNSLIYMDIKFKKNQETLNIIASHLIRCCQKDYLSNLIISSNSVSHNLSNISLNKLNVFLEFNNVFKLNNRCIFSL